MTEYRNRQTLDQLEPYYSRHISAMTAEDLFSKSDIAAELAIRDKRIAELELSAGHAMELHERWCNCDVEELSNAMTVLDQVLHEEPSDG